LNVATFNFTEQRIAGLSAPAKGEEVHNDTAVSGLSIRIRAGGSQSYFVRYRAGGRGSQQRRYTIGPARAVGLAEARRLASKILSDVRNGVDPAAAKKALAEAGGKTTTLAELVDTHERDQLFRGVVTARATATLLRRDFAQIVGENRNPRTVTRLELVQCIERVRDGVRGHIPPRPGLAPTFRARLYGLFETAVGRGDVLANPLSGFKAPRQSRVQRLEQAAKRVGRMLSMDEIAALWMACGDPRIRPAFGAYIQALIVLGSRRAETAAARLSWIKPARGDRPALLVIPAAVTKAGREHVLPLPPLATSIIAGVKRFTDTDLIFPGARSRKTGRTVQISGWSKSWPALLKVAREYGLTGELRLHDLRKSARSHWARLGIHDRVSETLLNHAESNVLIATYDKRDLMAEKNDALSLWCAEIEMALEARGKATDGSSANAAVILLHRPKKAPRQRPAAARALS
jgi:integrase